MFWYRRGGGQLGIRADPLLSAGGLHMRHGAVDATRLRQLSEHPNQHMGHEHIRHLRFRDDTICRI